MNQGQAFDQMTPKPSVTDPLGHGRETVYPKHLHKAGVAEDGGPLWLAVRNAEEEAAAITAGWLLERPDPASPAAGPPGGTSEAPVHPRRKSA